MRNLEDCRAVAKEYIEAVGGKQLNPETRPSAEMASKYTSSTAYWGAYAVDEETLRNFAKHISHYTGEKVEILIKTDDDHSIDSDNLDDPLSDSLLRGHVIKSVQLESDDYNKDPRRSVSMKLGHQFGAPIEVRITGDKAGAINLRQEIANEIKSAKSWYSLLVPKDRFWTLPSAILLLTSALYAAYLWYFDRSLETSFEGLVIAMAVAIAVTCTKRKLLPALTFNIGLSGERAKTLTQLRTIILVGILLGIMVAIVSNYISSRLFR